jgi:farnesyl-diphosphate farnesyltransferase
VQSLRHGKLRYATALPLLLAARTVALMKTASNEQLRAGVKISRLEVTTLLAKTALSNNAAGIRQLFEKMTS